MKYIYTHGNQFWYQRAVPEILVGVFEKKTLKVSLKTNKLNIAVKRANEQALKHSHVFRDLRRKKNFFFQLFNRKIYVDKLNCKFFDDFDPLINLNEQSVITKSFNKFHRNIVSKKESYSLPRISEVLHSSTKFNFTVAQKKSIKLLIDIVGDKVISKYNKIDVKNFKTDFFDKKCVGAGKMHQKNLVECFDYFCKEFIYFDFNIFKKIKWDFSLLSSLNYSELLKVKNYCLGTKNQISYAIAIMLNTGCTIKEIIGLKYDDIFLSKHKSYVIIRNNQYRQIKN